MTQREAILEGAKKATRLHEVLGTKENIEQLGGRVDVFEVIVHQGATLIFGDLKGLIGAYLSENGAAGIMITTQRPLAVQRFTAAHELGHYYMRHDPGVDGDEILGGSEALATVEVQANAFAAEFLAPKWLLFHHGRKQEWNGESILKPFIVYQLSLRLGLSYEATCLTLRNQGLISTGDLLSLRAVPPKKIKRQLLPESYEPENWFPDVWLLTERDQGLRIANQAGDLFVFHMKETHGAGYRWDSRELRDQGFAILSDEMLPLSGGAAEDGTAIRQIAVGPTPNAEGIFSLIQDCPGKIGHSKSTKLEIAYAVAGREKGLPRIVRPQLLSGRGWT
jgi:Zn-dependent peptidase ImmA (M78 family)